MNIKIVRLITGEELLCEVLPKPPLGGLLTKTVVRNPVRIVVVPSKNDPSNPSIALGPWGEFAEKKEFEFKSEHVIVEYEPLVDFKNQYQKMFGGILTPPQSLILPNA